MEVPPELQPYYPDGTQSNARPAQLKILLAVAVVVVALGLVAYFLVPWGSNTSHKTNRPQTTAQPSKGSQGPANQSPTGSVSKPSTGNSSSSSTGSSQSSNTLSQTQSQSGNQPQATNPQLVNTGPGTPIALFIGTVIFGVVVSELYRKRRALK